MNKPISQVKNKALIAHLVIEKVFKSQLPQLCILSVCFTLKNEVRGVVTVVF